MDLVDLLKSFLKVPSDWTLGWFWNFWNWSKWCEALYPYFGPSWPLLGPAPYWAKPELPGKQHGFGKRDLFIMISDTKNESSKKTRETPIRSYRDLSKNTGTLDGKMIFPKLWRAKVLVKNDINLGSWTGYLWFRAPKMNHLKKTGRRQLDLIETYLKNTGTLDGKMIFAKLLPAKVLTFLVKIWSPSPVLTRPPGSGGIDSIWISGTFLA